MQISDNCVIIYASYELNAISNITKSTSIHKFHCCHLPLNIYVFHIMHVCFTALILYSKCRLDITTCTCQRQYTALLFTMLKPYICQQQKLPSNAIYMPHMPITSCANMGQLRQYIYPLWAHCNQQCDQVHWYTLHSTSLVYALEQICLPHWTCMFHCTSTTVYK